MVDLATAAVIAKIVSDAVGAFDKVFRGYMDVLKRVPTVPTLPPPAFADVNSPHQNAFVARSRQSAQLYQTVTYKQLCERLSDGDREYIETPGRAMDSYQRQWLSVYEQRALASGMDVGGLRGQLGYLARQMSDPLIKVLTFVEKMGLYLDDHYMVARQEAAKYLKRNN
ncbi:hypothetical protein AYJ54_31050 [Bradyrhizobium centrolobii]|uniref:Uncharacterized protein n=1 Tax=Bradyrhizobium centrolobii TaxID=1505087 RepID=A0A176YA03_9BRAD|nr:hypothetical protein [Bradyrhizobium centrolobii]OAF00684.1 hypothetical protein AYJ54_31050 [Bradyrhizobium centrolobii]